MDILLVLEGPFWLVSCLRYYTGNFALRKPCWRLPEGGGVHALIAAGGFRMGEDRMIPGGCQEELEGFGRECVSPRKRPVLWFEDMGKYIPCMARGGQRLHASGEFLGSLRAAVLRGGV